MSRNGDELLPTTRFTREKLLGQGQFAEVFSASDKEAETSGSTRVAVKLARRPSCQSLLIEKRALQALSSTCTRIPKLIGVGKHDDRTFLVLTLLGENLADIRRQNTWGRSPNGRFSTQDALKLGLKILDAVEEVHEAGWIHRDVKPANLVVQAGCRGLDDAVIHLCDFGLARKFRGDDGSHVGERERAQFRGSTVYASHGAMSCRDQGRRDDLWSLLYIVVELFNGNLPWRRLTRPDASPGHDNYDWDRMRDLKLACQREPQQMSPERPLPRVLESLTEKLRSTEYDQRPAYDAIRRLLQQGVEECADAGQQDLLGPPPPFLQPPAPAVRDSVSRKRSRFQDLDHAREGDAGDDSSRGFDAIPPPVVRANSSPHGLATPSGLPTPRSVGPASGRAARVPSTSRLEDDIAERVLDLPPEAGVQLIVAMVERAVRRARGNDAASQAVAVLLRELATLASDGADQLDASLRGGAGVGPAGVRTPQVQVGVGPDSSVGQGAWGRSQGGFQGPPSWGPHGGWAGDERGRGLEQGYAVQGVMGQGVMVGNGGMDYSMGNGGQGMLGVDQGVGMSQGMGGMGHGPGPMPGMGGQMPTGGPVVQGGAHHGGHRGGHHGGGMGNMEGQLRHGHAQHMMMGHVGMQGGGAMGRPVRPPVPPPPKHSRPIQGGYGGGGGGRYGGWDAQGQMRADYGGYGNV